MSAAGRAARWRCLSLVGSLALFGVGPACRQQASSPSGDGPSDTLATFPSDRTVTIVATGQNIGTFEPCGCPGGMRGGLPRRATVISQLRRENPNLVLVDTGDQVPAFSADERFGYRRQIRDLTDAAILRGMRALTYDAVLIAAGDVDWGLERLEELGGRGGELPLVAANLFASADKSLAPPYRMVQTAPARVAVLGLIDAEAFALVEPETREKLRVADPLAAASSIVADLSGRTDLVIALTVGGPEFAERLARAVPDIDVIVAQPARLQGASRRSSGGRPIVIESPENGLAVGVLRVLLDEGHQIVASDYREVDIQRSITPDSPLAELWSALNFQVSRLRLIGEKKLASPSLVAADACRDCHPAQHEFWAGHRHASAYQTLLQKRRENDPHCLPCHVSGYGLEGGFVDLLSTPALANVTCVMCHQVDLATHAGDARTPVTPVDRELCTMCHTRDDSPRFYETADSYMQAGTCPSSR